MAKKVSLCLIACFLVVGLLVAGCAEKVDEKTGALVEEVVFTVVDTPGAAVRQMQAGDIDIYGFTITDPDLFEEIADDPNLEYGISYGGYREFRFNTAGPVFDDGVLNPFYVPEIREAMNWLVDRHYMVEEHLGGLGAPKWTFMGTEFPDSAERYPHIVAEIMEYYAYNPEKAAEIVTAEMEKLGAVLNDDGLWTYEGQVVELKVLIRSDLPPFPQAGEYFADLLEGLGFKTVRDLKPGTEANPIWIFSPPIEGQWHIYTGGWSSPSIPRCSAHTFEQFFTHRVLPWPVFLALEEPLQDFPELDEASRRLRQKDFTTMAEREELFTIGLWEGMKFANQVYICDTAGADPYRADVAIAVDLAGGIGDPAWVFTAHRLDEDGNPVAGTLRFGVPNILVDPYNPLDGSGYTYDMFVTRRSLGDMGIVPDPRTGLYWPNRIERAEVYMQTGLPVDITLDWLTLEFIDEIEVPGDAWADWDPVSQQFITAAERFPEGATALRKSVVYYPDDLYDFPLHDGSTLSVGDFIMAIIVHFDRGKEDSAIFDSAKQAGLEAWLAPFKGVRIVSEDPLVIETYSDMWYIDAEYNVSDWWPVYGTYTWSGFWHMITVGKLADAARELAMTAGKADDLGVEWMDYTKGPSLAILEKHMNAAAAENYIPYLPTLGEYITEDEASDRWSNLQAFYEERGHFWVGAGPYIFKEVHAVESIVVLEGNVNHPDVFDKWYFFLDPLAQ